MVPFIKWAGGKRQLLQQIKLRLPVQYGSYYEPFVGGGAVLFELTPNNAYINDINSELINTYVQIRDNAIELIGIIEEMDKMLCYKEIYYNFRERYNQKLLQRQYDTELAALFIFLNKHCFNGLYRVNSKGLFNVPWNNRTRGYSIDINNIKAISKYLSSVTITCDDFEKAVENVKKGDFIFFDSPYAPLNPTSFESYTKEGFEEIDHRRLACLFKQLDEKECYCMLTNHNTALINELYKEYIIEIVSVKRFINSDASKRVGEEVIIRNYRLESDYERPIE